MSDSRCSTGSPSLDAVFENLILGDNVVFRFSEITAYREACRTLARQATSEHRRLHYFRFAQHVPLIDEATESVFVHETHPSEGFERFINEIHAVIRREGLYGYYVFDVLSELSTTYFSDRMIGNFFRITCPFLRRLRTIAYFGVQRYAHTYHAIDLVRQTTQVMVDLYDYDGREYAQPVKLVGRNRPDLLRMHELHDGTATMVPDSAMVTRIIATTPWPGLPSASYRMVGIWDRTFIHAEEIATDSSDEQLRRSTFDELLFLLTGAAGQMRSLLSRYFTIEDLIRIWKRMIGTGMIGGKATGMLAAHAILKKEDPRWEPVLEEHDSFFIGSDVFYSFLVENDCWWFRQLQKDPVHYLDRNEHIRRQLLGGEFPPYITRRMEDMLEYFSGAPIIVRSSSLLEDAFGNAFAGKYDSIFCPNQGSREQRLQEFIDAARWIYAGTMSREALEYRKSRGILARDEQMALLVQRVSGRHHGNWYFPHTGGVGLSFNPYAWSPEIDPEAGVLRMVLGLGTRAVDISDEDFARVVALNAPRMRPESDPDEQRRYSQRYADVLNLKENRLETQDVSRLFKEATGLPVSLLGVVDRYAPTSSRRSAPARLPSFDPMFSRTDFVDHMHSALATLQRAYGAPVDMEFTATFTDDDIFHINVVQCRPLQVHGQFTESIPLPELQHDDILITSHGAVIGHSRCKTIDRIVMVRPDRYSELSESGRYEVARILRSVVGKRFPGEFVLLIGPGRWGTSTPSLGVPVRVNDIADAAAVMEVDVMHEGLVPDLSLGTHMFHEMVELDMLYVAHFMAGEGNIMDFEQLYALPDAARGHARTGVPEDQVGLRPESCIEDKAPTAAGRRLVINANTPEQRCVIYWEDTE
ncbi:MAG: PEP/pyruvate-binding domain-containing protein [Spirochaetia bacterium]